MNDYIIKNTKIVNESKIFEGDLLIRNQRIEKIDKSINVQFRHTEINGEGLHLLPGVIDDQVHFREPGFTHKATIYTESKAAVRGGVTSFMEMPNTMPPVFTHSLLEDKYMSAAQTSLANYSFFLGASNDNIEEIEKANKRKNEICGVKIFMGSSTGNLLVNSVLALEQIFSKSELLIATHCEEESIINKNYDALKQQKKQLQPADHAIIRNEDACFESSFKAIQYAKKFNSRLHILHISTAKELQLFTNMIPLKDKRITAEACVHHLHFTADDYEDLGYQIKCNPAIKASSNRNAIWEAILDDRIDIIATDHAPHLLSEKCLKRNSRGIIVEESDASYDHAYSGLPLVQHSLQLMLHYVNKGKISIEKVVEKMSHNVATCYQIQERGFIREGYFADLVMVNLHKNEEVSSERLLYKCGWSPLENTEFSSTIEKTFVNGQMVYGNDRFDESYKGKRLLFDR